MSNPTQPPHDSGSGERPGHCVEGERCVCGGDTPGVRAGCTNWRAALATPSQAVASALQAPEGWKLVPIEPTEKMEDAGAEAGDGHDWSGPREVWAAMLAAAPAHPVVQPGIQGDGHQAGASLLLACDSDESERDSS